MIDQNIIKRYFDESVATYGDSIHSVGWYSKDTQVKRFEVLAGVDELNGASVLDVGCGLGCFFEFLTQKYADLRYKGLDISQNMVDLAQKKRPDGDFAKVDFFSEDFCEEFDFVFASGTLNYRVEDAEAYINSAIEKMFKLAKKGVAFNLLSAFTHEDQKEDEFSYYYPTDILGICFAHTPKIELRHNYLPNDFSVFMYK